MSAPEAPSAPAETPAPPPAIRLLGWLGLFFAAQVPLVFLLPWKPWFPAVFPVGSALPFHVAQVNNVHVWWPSRDAVFFFTWVLFAIHLEATLWVDSWSTYRRLMIFFIILVSLTLAGSYAELKDQLLFDRPSWIELPAPAR